MKKFTEFMEGDQVFFVKRETEINGDTSEALGAVSGSVPHATATRDSTKRRNARYNELSARSQRCASSAVAKRYCPGQLVEAARQSPRASGSNDAAYVLRQVGGVSQPSHQNSPNAVLPT